MVEGGTRSPTCADPAFAAASAGRPNVLIVFGADPPSSRSASSGARAISSRHAPHESSGESGGTIAPQLRQDLLVVVISIGRPFPSFNTARKFSKGYERKAA